MRRSRRRATSRSTGRSPASADPGPAVPCRTGPPDRVCRCRRLASSGTGPEVCPEDAVAERQEQAAPDAVLTRIGQVVMLHHGGDREEARRRFLDLWAELGEDGAPLHRCTLAHYLADTQDDPSDELAWDLRALSAAEELAEELTEDRAPG